MAQDDTSSKSAKESTVKSFLSDKKLYEKGENELTIREGDAEKIFYPKAVSITGIISAPSAFYAKRKTLHNPEKCHVTFNNRDDVIKLICDEQNNESGYTITGKIERNPDLNNFSINKNQMLTIKELMGVLKFNRIFFNDKDENGKIVASLQSFKAKVAQELEESNNLRGEEKKLKVSKLEHALAENFVLNMPIHKGGAPKTFKVDICVQVTDGDVQVWLESRDLNDMLMATESEMIKAELENFKDIVCIEQ